MLAGLTGGLAGDEPFRVTDSGTDFGGEAIAVCGSRDTEPLITSSKKAADLKYRIVLMASMDFNSMDFNSTGLDSLT